MEHSAAGFSLVLKFSGDTYAHFRPPTFSDGVRKTAEVDVDGQSEIYVQDCLRMLRRIIARSIQGHWNGIAKYCS